MAGKIRYELRDIRRWAMPDNEARTREMLKESCVHRSVATRSTITVIRIISGDLLSASRRKIHDISKTLNLCSFQRSDSLRPPRAIQTMLLANFFMTILLRRSSAVIVTSFYNIILSNILYNRFLIIKLINHSVQSQIVRTVCTTEVCILLRSFETMERQFFEEYFQTVTCII